MVTVKIKFFWLPFFLCKNIEGDLMSKKEKEPTLLQQRIVEMWANGVKNSDIAAELGCSIETVRLVKKNPDLKKNFYERQRENIVGLVPMAINRLKNILQDDKTQASVVIAAIKETLDRANLNEVLDAGDKEIKISIEYVDKAVNDGNSEI
jgi:DNA replication protein DnaD